MDKFSENTKILIEESVQLLSEISQIGLNTHEKFSSDNFDFETFFYLAYLERFKFNISCVSVLLKNIQEHPYLETSIGLTIRATLLDFMIITNLLSYKADIKSEKDIDGLNKYKNEFDSVIADQMWNSIKYVKTAKNTGIINAIEYKRIIDNIWIQYGNLFISETPDYEAPESKLITTVFKSAKQYFMRIHNHAIVKEYSNSYDLYIYYSKYDHFGIMTHYMQRKDINKDVSRIIDSLKYMIRGFGGCLILVSNEKRDLKDEKVKLRVIQDAFDEL